MGGNNSFLQFRQFRKFRQFQLTVGPACGELPLLAKMTIISKPLDGDGNGDGGGDGDGGGNGYGGGDGDGDGEDDGGDVDVVGPPVENYHCLQR